MYGPGQPPQQQWQAQPSPYQTGQQPPSGQPYGSQPAPPHQPDSRSRRSAQPRPGLAVLATVVVLGVTGAVNATWAPISFLNQQFRGLWLVGGDPLFLAAAQGVTGVACLVFGVLLLTRQGFAWGGALVSVLAFGMFEAYCINRGVAEHFVGLFLVVVVVALLNQASVRRFCGIGPLGQ